MDFNDYSEESNEGKFDWKGILIGAGIIYLIYKISTQDKILQQVSQSQLSQVATNTSTYENDEKWQIERGEDGHIVDLRVMRNAKVSDGATKTQSDNYQKEPKSVSEPKSISQSPKLQAPPTRIKRMNESDRMKTFRMV